MSYLPPPRLERLECRDAASSLLGSSWPQPGGRGTPVVLTYSISNLADGGLTGFVSPAGVHDAVARALAAWAAVAPIQFTEVPIGGDVVFARAELNDSIAGQAFAPGSGQGGDIMIDNDRPWGVGGQSGTIPFDSVLVHEVGHSLGLGHEPFPPTGRPAIMNPAVQFGAFPGLFPDDVGGIQGLYGEGVGFVRPLDGGPDDAPPNASALGGIVSVHGFRDSVTSRFSPYQGYTGEVSLSYDGDVLRTCADNGHAKSFDAAGRTLASDVIVHNVPAGSHVSAGDLGGDGSLDAVVSGNGRVDAATFAGAPYADYAGEIRTAVAGGLLVTLAGSHVKVFNGQNEVASFFAYADYGGSVTFGAGEGAIYTIADNSHVKAFDSSSFALTQSFLRPA